MPYAVVLGLAVAAAAPAQQQAETPLQQERIAIQQLIDTTNTFRNTDRQGDPGVLWSSDITSGGRNWGMCVVRTAPDDARLYAKSRGTDARRDAAERLAPVFERCRDAGRLAFGETRRGAVRGALAAIDPR